MPDTTPDADDAVFGATSIRRPRRLGLKLALVGAGIAAGAVGATAVVASAQTATTGSGSTASTSASAESRNSSSGSSAPTGAPSGPNGARPANAHGAASVRSDEKVVTGTTAATLKAAALKAVPGGTVYRVETDAGDGTYEAHMTKADGTEVTVKFDKSLKVTAVEAGMGKGDPAPSR